MRVPRSLALLIRSVTAILIALATLTTFHINKTQNASAQEQPLAWRETNVTLKNNQFVCVDVTRPNSIVYEANDGSQVSTNWNTGQSTTLTNDSATLSCYEGDPVYRSTVENYENKAYRYDRKDGQWHPLEYAPSEIAEDGTPQLYALTGAPNSTEESPKTRLMYSSDAGVTWQERGQQLKGDIVDIAIAKQDARAIYAAVSPVGSPDYTIYFSSDAGVNWEMRSTGKLEGRWYDNHPSVEVSVVPGANAPIDDVQMVLDEAIMGSSNKWHYLVSGDGGRTFSPTGLYSLGENVQLYYTNNGIYRLQGIGSYYTLSFSTDGGKTWQQMPVPWSENEYLNMQSLTLKVDDSAPQNLFISGIHHFWYSPDAGNTWKDIAITNGDFYYRLSPYMPLTVLATQYNVTESHLRVLDLPNAGKGLTAPATPSNASGSLYYRETGHNLSGVFKQYWEGHGGLAQFGFPRTEVLWETSTDGHIYAVQYFERNRFEWHPENRGTANEVLLGLLGAQLTKDRRDAHEGPFNPIADPKEQGRTFYPQTGHTLRNAFKIYWENHGGLSIYGYPISEEFYEVNKQDGKTYVVQYFERNRFEWHPENVNSPYEVLLGSLGNELLQIKGW